MLQSYFSRNVSRPQQQMDFASSVCLPQTSCGQNVISQDGLTICQSLSHLCNTYEPAPALYLLDGR